MPAWLEAGLEIIEGVGTCVPRIEELATRKLRSREPGLTSEWDEMQEAQRRALLHMRMRMREHEARQLLERDQRAQLGRGLRLGVSQAK